MPSAGVEATERRNDNAQSCLLPTDTFGFAEVRVDGFIPTDWVVDASFGLSMDSKSFHVSMSEAEIGHFDLTFETPGRDHIPGPQTYDVTAPGPDTIRTSVRGNLVLFRESKAEDTYINFVPRAGKLTFAAATLDGVCGAFDVEWTSQVERGSDSSVIRTRGKFRAVRNEHVPSPKGRN